MLSVGKKERANAKVLTGCMLDVVRKYPPVHYVYNRGPNQVLKFTISTILGGCEKPKSNGNTFALSICNSSEFIDFVVKFFSVLCLRL